MGPGAAQSCVVRQIGYLEAENPIEMPERGRARPIPLRPLNALPSGLDGSVNEQILRDDVVELWRIYRGLPPDRRRQFLQAAAKGQEAAALWRDRSTLSFALLVVACEALKPSAAVQRATVYDVIAALLGKATSDRLRQSGGELAAQTVRSVHLHTGEFLGDELIYTAFNSSYRDPSFAEAHRDLTQVTRLAIAEWLRRQGAISLGTREKSRKTRREFDRLWIATALGAGVLAGWILRSALS